MECNPAEITLSSAEAKLVAPVRDCSECIGVEQLGADWKINVEAVANDKGGGYSMVHPEVLTNIHLQLLGNGQYFESDFTNWDERCAKASMSYSEWCKRVEDLEREPDRARTLRKSLSSVGAKIEVQLVTSCKSHKPSGEIKFSICWPRTMVRKTIQRTVEAVPYLVP